MALDRAGEIAINFNFVSNPSFALGVRTRVGDTLVLVRCHNRTTAEFEVAKATRQQAASRTGAVGLTYVVAVPGERVIAAPGF